MATKDQHNIISVSIRRKLMLSIALVHAVLMSFFVFDYTYKNDEIIEKEIEKRTQSLSQNLANQCVPWVLSHDIVALEEHVNSFVKYEDLEYAMIVDNEGKVLAHTDFSRVGSYLVDPISLKLLKSEPKGMTAVNDDYLIDVGYPIIQSKMVLGWVRVSLNKTNMIAHKNELFVEGLIYTLIAIIIGTVIAYFLASGLTRTLYSLIKVMSLTIKGERHLRARVTRKDEVGVLALVFNEMLETLESKEASLKELNETLEEKVKVKTAALEKLNNNLEARIKEEVDKNKEQIKQMLIQSRHAQMGEMISMIAHQWRQPLSSMGATTSSLRVKQELGDTQ